MSTPNVEDRVAAIRTFNRFYTGAIGVLDEGLLDTAYSLTEARVIFELAQREVTDLSHLRRTLSLDAGYLSRLLTRLQNGGLVAREPSTADGRRQVIRLTGAGRATFETLDDRAAGAIRTLLGKHSEEDQQRLVAAMNTIRQVLEPAPSAASGRSGAEPSVKRPELGGTQPQAYLLRPLRPGDIGWVVHRHGIRYAEEFGWDETFEALVARIVADYVDHRDPQRENAWIADVDGSPVGCIFCTKKDQETAQLRLLLVEPGARGLGIGARLVEECLRYARRVGYEQITLWTNDVLAGARRLYERAGFRLVDEEPHHSFGHDLVGQHWSRNLKKG